MIGGGFLQLPAVRIIQENGGHAVVLDMDPHAPALSLARDFIDCSTLNAEQAVLAVRAYHQEKQRLDAVFTVGTDASYTVACIAADLGLPGISPQAALAASDKFLMRETLQQAGVSIPGYSLVESEAQLQTVYQKLGPRVVLKPVRNMGARGISLVARKAELQSAYDLARSYSKDGKVLMETYIEGPELSLDALIYDGKITITGIADRLIEYPPYFVETGHIMPSILPQDYQDRAVDVFCQAIHALGITQGAAKGDIKTGPQQAWIGEVAARLSGGFMSAYTYPLSSGVDLIANALCIALGSAPPDLRVKYQKVAVERAIIAAPGHLQKITGLAEAEQVDSVELVQCRCQGDCVIESPRNNLDKCGNIISAAYERRNALQAAHEARLRIAFHYEQRDSSSLWEKSPWSTQGRNLNYPVLMLSGNLDKDQAQYKQASLSIKTVQYNGIWPVIYFSLTEPAAARLVLENYCAVIAMVPITEWKETKELIRQLYRDGCWIAGLDMRRAAPHLIQECLKAVPRDLRLWLWVDALQLDCLAGWWDRFDAIILDKKEDSPEIRDALGMSRVIVFSPQTDDTTEPRLYPIQIGQATATDSQGEIKKQRN